jgi:hypothetical protein
MAWAWAALAPYLVRAVAEKWRVPRPGGQLLLADHVVSASTPVRLLQRVLEVVTIPIGGENFRRRPIAYVREQARRRGAARGPDHLVPPAAATRHLLTP